MVEAAALTGAALGVEAFEYNRQNFMYDREQRRTKEYTEIDFRIEQAAQWREDVRDIVALQEKKSKTYCLVAVITLGFSMSLWCQGRLPIGTPTWIMLGNQVAAGAGFCFLTMVIWLGIYASVCAQGYHCRLLTQLVRLPIPTWQEVEACRTYGSSFEKLEGRQLFRVPFLTGPQERLVTQGSGTSTAADSGTSQVEGCGSGREATPAEGSIATDPWGLESRGDRVYELGCRYSKDAAEMRHIKLVRHAALFWQSYDAFARISLTIGINQVMLGISYFILGNMAVSLKAPFGAYGGVFALMVMAEAIGKLDMMLPPFQQVLMNALLFAGPLFACVASYHVSGTLVTMQDDKVARFWACGAFICHGMMSLCMCLFCRVRETSTGDYVPEGFKSVLWLDAFGWLSQPGEESNGPDISSTHGQPISSDLVTASQTDVPGAPSMPDVALPASEFSARPEGQAHVGHSDSDQIQADEPPIAAGAAAEGAECGQPRSFHPGLETVCYNAADGHSCPKSYRDFVPSGANSDMQGMAEAPQVQQLSASSPGSKFFNASSFVPPSKSPEEVAVDEIMTGHDGERPGLLPWKVFRNATCLLGIVWMIAAAYQVLDAMDIVEFAHFAAPAPMSQSKPHANATQLVYYPATRPQASHLQNLLQLWQSSFSGAPVSSAPEKLAALFPMVSMIPQGLSCDPAGRVFAVTDGISTFRSQLGKSNIGGSGGVDHVSSKQLNFQETEGCTALLGEAADDVALVCGDTGLCKALVLHRNGNRVAVCPLGKESSGHGVVISQQWLHSSHDPEQVAWISASPLCRPEADSDSLVACISVGTTHGRFAELQRAKESFVPERVMPEEHAEPSGSAGTWQAVRAFNRRYVGVLQPKAGSIQIFDAANDMADAGTLTLPAQSHHVSSFCAGGGYVYIVTERQEMWRIPLPESLLP